ncbi:MAG: BON domain-containing protein, partial [Bdellovibrionota bacterium]
MKVDKQIQKDVIKELAWNPAITETHVGVSVEDGIVTLSGKVPSYAEKAAAETSAMRVEG